MIHRKLAIALVGLIGVIALISCTAPTPVTTPASQQLTTAPERVDLKADYAALRNTGGKVYTLDPQTSQVRIYVYRGGRAARLGHNHVLSAPRFTGFVHLPSGETTSARFDLEFRLDELEFDHPEHRSTLGKAYASILSPEAIASTREHMLSAGNMQAGRFPFVRIHSLQITGESPRLAANIEIEMHGQKHEIRVPLSIEGLPEKLSVTGSFVLRQTDFGVQPYSVLGGLLAVQDEIVIDFKLIGA